MHVLRWDIFFHISLHFRSPPFACSMAVLAEIQHYTITYLIKHYHAQQGSGAKRRVGVLVLTAAESLVNLAKFLCLGICALYHLAFYETL